MWVLFFHTLRFSSTTTVCIARRWRATCFKCWSSCVTLYPRRRVWQTDGLRAISVMIHQHIQLVSKHIYTFILMPPLFFFLNHFKSFCFQVMWLNRHLRFYNRNFLFCIRSTFVIVFFFLLFPPCFLRRLSPTGNSPIWDIEMTEVSSTVESTHSKVKLKENPCHTSQRQGRCDESLKSG